MVSVLVDGKVSASKRGKTTHKYLFLLLKALSPRKLAASSNRRLKEEREKVRHLLGEEQRATDLRKARELFDPNGTGTIDVNRIAASSFPRELWQEFPFKVFRLSV